MHALLIYPRTPETFWSLTHALRLINRKAGSPPLGLLTVAAMLPADWELRLVDLNVSDLTDYDLDWADCALLSGMLVQRDSALKAAARCKSAGLTVIARSGNHPVLLPPEPRPERALGNTRVSCLGHSSGILGLYR